MLLRDLMTEITKPITAANRITGSASMNIGCLPDVSVTIVDESRTRQIPDAKMIRPVCSFCFLRAIT